MVETNYKTLQVKEDTKKLISEIQEIINEESRYHVSKDSVVFIACSRELERLQKTKRENKK